MKAQNFYSPANGSAVARLATARKLVAASPAHTYSSVGVVGLAKQLGSVPVGHSLLTFKWWSHCVSNGLKQLHHANGVFVK